MSHASLNQDQCPCGREVRPYDLREVIGRSWMGCVGCKEAPEDCKCLPQGEAPVGIGTFSEDILKDLESLEPVVPYEPSPSDTRWVEAMKRVCEPWKESLEHVGWGSPEGAITCFASAVRLEERRRLAKLTPEELQEQFAYDRALSAPLNEGK